MARNGSGTYSLPAGNPVVTGTTITSTWANTTLADIGTALTGSIAADGQTPITANLPMSGYKHTGVAVASALTDYARYDQVQNSAPQWLTSVSGTDTITASASPTPAAYAAGQTFRFVAAGANTGAATLNVSSLGAKSITKNGTSPLTAGDIQNGSVVEVTYDGTRFQLKNVSVSSLNPGINDFRLTLTSGTPVTTSDVTGASTIYCCPYTGPKIGLYDGSSWNIRTSAQFSLALSGLTSGKPYDVFCYDNSGTPTLEFLVWTNDTTRATALAYQDGVLVKSGDATRRYLGTFYTTGTTTTEDSVTNRYLYNYYHRASRAMVRRETTASWTYSTAAWRQANNSASNQLNFVQGVAEDAIKFQVQEVVESTGAGDNCYSGIGIDSTTAIPASQIGGAVQIQASGRRHGISCGVETTVAAGRHYAAWLEYGNGSNTQTWYGTVGPVSFGIIGEVFA